MGVIELSARPAARLAALLASAFLALATNAQDIGRDQPGSGGDSSRQGALPSPAELESLGAVVGRVRVRTGNVFDTRIDGEDGWLYRTANRLHIQTRPSVILRQLLFEPGDPYKQRLLAESERILRSNAYLYDARIVPVAFDGESVDIEVQTRDVWTLSPGFNFGRKGGANKFGLQIEEKNLLGFGKEVRVEWRDNVDRTSLIFGYKDAHFFRRFLRLNATYADSSDGKTKALRLERPFYALDTRRSAGMELFDSLRNDARYALGENVGEFEHREEYYELRGGLSRGLRDLRVNRWTTGFTYDRDRFEELPDISPGGPLPEDRLLIYPWVGFETIEDRFEERRNQDQILRTEDLLLGLRAAGRAGLALESLGSDRDAVILSAYLQHGTDVGPGHSVFADVAASGRLEDDGLRNGILSAGGRYYWRTSRRSKFYLSLHGTITEELDQEQQLLLGGDNGLRGYPLRYQAGTARALLTLEQRYYTRWYPFRLFHVGAAAFFDMGRTWGRDVTGLESAGLLKDVGVGLRFGSSRSSFGNVIHIDLAFPLDGDDSIDAVQVLVETKGSF